MGIPEERLKQVNFGIKMEAKMEARLEAKRTTMKAAESRADDGFHKANSLTRSPLSSLSNTDSDDSVDVRVRSPTQPKYRKRPREAAPACDAAAAAADAKTESDGSDGERPAGKRVAASDGFVVPKKRFRREYEAAARLGNRSDGEPDAGGRQPAAAARVPGCARHRQVVFECAACLEAVAQRFGWPAHALRSPAPLPLPLPLAPLPMPFSPFVEPLLALQAFGADPRLSAGLLTASRPGRRASPPPPPPPPAAAAPPRARAAEEEAPLDLTRRRSGSGSGNGSGGGRFSIENILAGRTAPQEHPAARVAGRAAPPLSPPRPAAAVATAVAVAAAKSKPAASPARRAAPLPQAGDRRELANERERMRVKHLTGAFKELSASIGGIASECIGTSGVKFTKVAILRTASLYIGYLSHLLSDGPGATEEKVYDQMRSAILEVMTSKSKKGKDEDDDDEEEL